MGKQRPVRCWPLLLPVHEEVCGFEFGVLLLSHRELRASVPLRGPFTVFMPKRGLPHELAVADVLIKPWGTHGNASCISYVACRPQTTVLSPSCVHVPALLQTLACASNSQSVKPHVQGKNTAAR